MARRMSEHGAGKIASTLGLASALLVAFTSPVGAQLEKVEAKPEPTETRSFGDLAEGPYERLVLRNVMERRSELGVFRALGFARVDVQGLVVREHLTLLIAGMLCGAGAAVVGVLPSMMSPGADVPVALAAGLGLAVFLNGLFWTVLAAGLSLRGPMLEGLGSE